MVHNEGLQLGQLEGSVEILGDPIDDPAHGGADGGVVVAAEPVPVVSDPVPGEVATNDVLAYPGDHPVAVLLPHPAGLVHGHVEVAGEHPHLAGAGHAVQEDDFLVGVVGGCVAVPHPVPHTHVTRRYAGAEHCRAHTELDKETVR